MEIYLVGGAVRDTLLGYPVHERDWVVVGASPEMMLNLGYRQVGKDFPVFLHPHNNEEYALARTERKNGRGYTGFSIDADANVTLEQDLQRRDLTINAIAQAHDGQLIDPYGGLADIAQRQLRHISPAFAEDPLRILRLARFAARFAIDGFTIAEQTLTLMRQLAAADELAELSCERVWKETERALATSSPVVYFETLISVAALTPWFAELQTGHAQPAFIRALVAATTLTDSVAIRWVAAVSTLNSAAAHALNQRLRVPTELQILTEQAQLISVQQLEQAPAELILQHMNGADCWRRPQRWPQLLMIWQAQGLSTSRVQVLSRAMQQLQTVKASDLIASAAAAGQVLQGTEVGLRVNQERLRLLQQAL
ncbi:CCA tRNA nucleotidyltransferase [Pseudidiomarina mangrovi]|uniref:CCA tRNA nucleotidyltransferase n=1 Tax=Pseudidiomarina mangrovi TaxID=2487133 RepID=UPI000FCABDDD|nr:CCA tRNA nucleotidyltransferase [Pseudidiomarina mangrovi]CAI8155453.1 MAG: Multifunctional CCA protein [Pseudidiomarina mangrovi]